VASHTATLFLKVVLYSAVANDIKPSLADFNVKISAVAVAICVVRSAIVASSSVAVAAAAVICVFRSVIVASLSVIVA
jgi:hypothetical protein